jgi:hypothetical protein
MGKTPFSDTRYHININIWEGERDVGYLYEPFSADNEDSAEKWVVARVKKLSNALGEGYHLRATFFPDIVNS